jgi:hypothetical protein
MIFVSCRLAVTVTESIGDVMASSGGELMIHFCEIASEDNSTLTLSQRIFIFDSQYVGSKVYQLSVLTKIQPKPSPVR